ncbi:MAG: chemotaxis protein CheD [Bryobacteraceae bacterium]|nr:chemotaxis protein CheD [Bryobacteraceae bacterium]
MSWNTSCRPSTESLPEAAASRPAGQKPLIVGVGDCRVSADPHADIITYALGSCIAVAIWDPVAKVGGLLHFMLPDSSVDRVTGGRENPYRYADTGTPMLFRAAYQQGAEKRRLLVRLAGGAAVVNDEGVFNIGKRNYAALRKILWKAGVMVHGEDVGGSNSRTVRLEVGTGRFFIRGPREGEKELSARAECATGGRP